MSHLNIKTLLNAKENFKGFVFKNTRLVEKNETHRIEVEKFFECNQRQSAQCPQYFGSFPYRQKINEAIDKVRNLEAKELKKKGKDIVLKNARWALLKRVENLTEKQSAKLKDLLACNLKTIKAYLLKEEFDYFWQYNSSAWASKFLKSWTTKVMRSKLEPMKSVAKTIRNHEDLILNWFEAKGQLHLGAVEGLNNKLKTSIRNSYGIKTFKILEVMLFHRLADLPVSECAHKFFN